MMESASLHSQSQQQEVKEASSAKENRLQRAQQNSIQEGGGTTTLRGLGKGKKPVRSLGVNGPSRIPYVIPKLECRSIEQVVTTSEQHGTSASTSLDSAQGSTGKSAADSTFETHENAGELQDISNVFGVLETRMSDKVLAPSTVPRSSICKNIFALHHNSADSDVEEDSSSDITMTSGDEAIDQLKAINEDLKSESKYYRLMAEITMKTAALRRGYMRSPIVPSSLCPQLCGLHQVLISEGLKLPNSAFDRAHVVADVIELHLSWEIDNLKHTINPSAAINSFVEFAALFVPQIRGLAIAEFVGGEETDEVRAGISAVVLKLVCWIVEQSAMLGESLVPQYLPYQRAGWYEQSIKALWDLDTCLEAACQQRMQSFPEAKAPGSYTEAPGLYSARIMSWAFGQLSWVNKMAGRLQRSVDKVPNHYGVKVELFGLTRQALKNYIRHGQHQNEVAWQLKEIENAKAKLLKQGKDQA